MGGQTPGRRKIGLWDASYFASASTIVGTLRTEANKVSRSIHRIQDMLDSGGPLFSGHNDNDKNGIENCADSSNLKFSSEDGIQPEFSASGSFRPNKHGGIRISGPLCRTGCCTNPSATKSRISPINGWKNDENRYRYTPNGSRNLRATSTRNATGLAVCYTMLDNPHKRLPPGPPNALNPSFPVEFYTCLHS